MCIIIDANQYGEYLDEGNDEMEPVRQWVQKPKSKNAYSPTPDFEREFGNKSRPSRMKNYLNALSHGNKIKTINKDEVLRKQAKLRNIKSDDPHILALALAGKVKLLVSGDKDLHADFKALIKGAIYQNKSHRRLLTPDLCP